MVLTEAFAVHCQAESMESLAAMTVDRLAERAKMPAKDVLQRLQRIQTMAADVEITGPELAEKLVSRSSRIFLLDVRAPWEYEICHIEGSERLAGLDLAQIFGGLKELEVITICHHGIRSLSAAFYLREAGLPRVRSLEGGLDLWARTVDKAMRRY